MNKSKKTLASIAFALMSVASVQAQKLNLPLIQTKYTADPAPYVHGDTVYLYTTHDEEGADGFLIQEMIVSMNLK